MKSVHPQFLIQSCVPRLDPGGIPCQHVVVDVFADPLLARLRPSYGNAVPCEPLHTHLRLEYWPEAECAHLKIY